MARKSTMNVSLTPQLHRWVLEQVRSGRYESASEVCRAAVRALQLVTEYAPEFWEYVEKREIAKKFEEAKAIARKKRSRKA